ncbi:MAG: hypothetical protein NUW01_01690 [Gemmatimonadaceae bacterium]|nr:hypothetical protein [Gemmatimonadaceae bacterium]
MTDSTSLRVRSLIHDAVREAYGACECGLDRLDAALARFDFGAAG